MSELPDSLLIGEGISPKREPLPYREVLILCIASDMAREVISRSAAVYSNKSDVGYAGTVGGVIHLSVANLGS